MAPSRAEYLHIRLTPEDKAKLQAAADRLGLSLSAYIRMAALKQADKS